MTLHTDMTKLGIFFGNDGIKDKDCTQIVSNNPGMSGTPYMFCLISYLLSTRDNGIDVTLMTTSEGRFADNIKTIRAKNIKEAYQISEELGLDYLLFNHEDHYGKVYQDIFMRKGNVKLIVWCHNFVNSKLLTLYHNSPNVCRIITVGREQMDLYRDHAAFQKSDFIYNAISVPSLNEDTFQPIPFSERRHIVTYMGAVIQGKGFHLLAKAWKDVLKEVPDAELYVIGTGRLYGNTKLGSWNLAEKYYEDSFMKYLTEDGKLLPSVHLMGVMGNEKMDILRQTKVGVPNPSGLTETFCVSGVEMQLAGARIAAYECAGYLDTIFNGTIFKKRSLLAKTIVSELKRQDNDYHSAIENINARFSQENVIRDWERLFTECIPQGTRLHPIYPLCHADFKLKACKDGLRKLKTRFPFLYHVMPSAYTLQSVWDKVTYKVYKLRNGFKF